MLTRKSVRMATGIFGEIATVLALSLLAGCSTGARRTHPASAGPASAPATQASNSNEPMSILRASLARCQTLAGYQIVFHRQERRGLLNKLSDWEDIKVCYRKEPCSVKMTWLDPASEYQECVYVQGTNEDKVTVLPRKGLFGMAAVPISVPPEMAVTMGKSLRPITEFGLAFMVRHTLESIDQAKGFGEVKVTYEGLATVDKIGVKAHHVAICYPKGSGHSARQDIYIDVATGYPVGSYQWLSNGDLLAAYLYEEPAIATSADEAFSITPSKAVASKN